MPELRTRTLLLLTPLLALAAFDALAVTSGSALNSSPRVSFADGRGNPMRPGHGSLTAEQRMLLGQDEDRNGVRDDVDRFIAEKYSVTPLMGKAVTAYARNVTSAILAPASLLTDEASSTQLAVYFCGSEEIDKAALPLGDNWNKVILGRVADTEERMRAYDKWDRAQTVSTSLNREVDACVLAGLTT